MGYSTEFKDTYTDLSETMQAFADNYNQQMADQMDVGFWDQALNTTLKVGLPMLTNMILPGSGILTSALVNTAGGAVIDQATGMGYKNLKMDGPGRHVWGDMLETANKDLQKSFGQNLALSFGTNLASGVVGEYGKKIKGDFKLDETLNYADPDVLSTVPDVTGDGITNVMDVQALAGDPSLGAGLGDEVSKYKDLTEFRDAWKKEPGTMLFGDNDVGKFFDDFGTDVSQKISDTQAHIKGKFLAKDGNLSNAILNQEDLDLMNQVMPKGNPVTYKGNQGYFDQPQYMGHRPVGYQNVNGRIMPVYGGRR